jgi:hypothetical protein
MALAADFSLKRFLRLAPSRMNAAQRKSREDLEGAAVSRRAKRGGDPQKCESPRT